LEKKENTYTQERGYRKYTEKKQRQRKREKKKKKRRGDRGFFLHEEEEEKRKRKKGREGKKNSRKKGILRDIGIPLLVKRELQKKYRRRTFERRNKRMSVLESTRD